MNSRWSDTDARDLVSRYADAGVSDALALRVYTSRLLGADPALVLHGGGNTSVKTSTTDLLGETVDVLCVKGSGWDLGGIEPAGLPAVRMAPLMALRDVESLSDEAMVSSVRSALIDASSPTPSVETLLHAWLPDTFIDHTHANAVLAITDQPDGMERCRHLFGADVTILPYIMPGFALAKAVDAAVRERPGVRGLLLHKHGIFSMGPDARTAYETMIELVSRAEDAIAESTRTLVPCPAISDAEMPALHEIAPLLRGVLAGGRDPGQRRFVLHTMGDSASRAFAAGEAVERYANAGTITPDHVIRIKPWPLITAPPAGDLATWRSDVEARLDAFVERYESYVNRHRERVGVITPLDPLPRWIVIPGVGILAAGRTAKAASLVRDLAAANVRVITDAESIGSFESIDLAEAFDVEYWSLEQAKLSKRSEPPLAGHVVVVTGGAGTIGRATGRAFAAAGAAVVLLDVNETPLRVAADEVGAVGLAVDVTDARAVAHAFADVCTLFGGVDVVVSNAGNAPQGRIGDVDEAVLRASFELNFFAHQHVAQAAVNVMRKQEMGGVLLFNVSKQAVNPGRDFGPYGLPKAATLALVRQYALDHGADGIRANGVNADRIPSGILTEDMIRARSKARGVDEHTYLAGNLLQRPVSADDVARAFLHLAMSEASTGAVLTVDGGNIAAALR